MPRGGNSAYLGEFTVLLNWGTSHPGWPPKRADRKYPGAEEGGLPLYPPLRSRCLYRIFRSMFPRFFPISIATPRTKQSQLRKPRIPLEKPRTYKILSSQVSDLVNPSTLKMFISLRTASGPFIVHCSRTKSKASISRFVERFLILLS